MTKIAIIIACEKYQDPDMPPRPYAEADAVAFGKVLERHGFAARDQLLLLNAGATKTVLESKVRKLLRGATDRDVVYFFYAGHSFARQGANYLTCHDTQLADLHETSVPLSWLFREFKNCACRNGVLCWDACDRELLAIDELRELYTGRAEAELETFFDDTPPFIGFASCRTGEVSHPNNQLKHGIWSYHLIEALNGDVPAALEKNQTLTSRSLQKHLLAAVPRSLRKAYPDKRKQSPQQYGDPTGKFCLADLADVATSNKSSGPTAKQVRHVRLAYEEVRSVRSLSGFKKGLAIPEVVTNATEAFVAKLAGDDLSRDLDEVHAALRKSFGFKRADLNVGNPELGAATIITPFFTYNAGVRLDPADPSKIIWRREIADIQEPDRVISAEFDEVFGATFNRIDFAPPRAIDVKSLIDRIEDLNDDRFTLSYDREATACTLAIAGIVGTVHVTADAVEIVLKKAAASKRLMQSLFEIQQTLAEEHDIRLLSLDRS